MRQPRSATILLVSVLLAACASTPERPPRAVRVELAAGKIAEECFSLKAGDRIDYQFESTGAVDFNLHTHRGTQIVMPVDVKRTRAQAGVFASPLAEDYCMMWTNASAAPAHITGEWTLRR